MDCLFVQEVTDGELDDIVRTIHRDFPMCGCKQMNGHLRSRGLRIQQSRIRESLRRTDPERTIV